MSLQYSLFFIHRFKGKVLFNVPMRDYTSFRIGGPCDVMAFPQDEGDLHDLLQFAEAKDFPLFVLGGGTNLLVRDGGIRGIVVNMAEGFGDMRWEDETKVVCGAGVGMRSLVMECADRGLTGLEFACGIPGSVGGAVVMNAGAYGGEMKDVVEGVEVVWGRRKRFRGFLSRREINFSYRRTELPKGSVIVNVHIRLKKADPGEIRKRMREYGERRRATSAVGFPGAGSIFKNPEGMNAGRLIEEVGLKGKRYGDAQISDVHANYIVNLGRAKAKDVLGLMALARDMVYRIKGVVLEPEIRVVGED